MASARASFFTSLQSIAPYCTQRVRTETSLPLLNLPKCGLNLQSARGVHLFPRFLCGLSSASTLQKNTFVCSVHPNGGVGGDEGSIAVALGEDLSKTAELKLDLEDSIRPTERGFQADAEIRSEIMELITQLEAHNPNPNPLELPDLFDGKWILRYTSLSEFFALLAAGSMPLIKIGEISQTVNADEALLVNSVTFIGLLGTTTLTANASFEICSPKRLQIKFEEGIVGAPQITNTLDLPESFTFLGQKVDLTAFQGIFQALQNATVSIARTISGQPPLKFPIRSENAQPWLLTTYLDHDLRISRGDNGSVFVFVKDAAEGFE